MFLVLTLIASLGSVLHIEPHNSGFAPRVIIFTCFTRTHYHTLLYRTDDELESYTANVKKTRKFAVLGKNSVIKFISKNQVKRVSLAGNKITNLAQIEELTAVVKNNLLELSFA